MRPGCLIPFFVLLPNSAHAADVGACCKGTMLSVSSEAPVHGKVKAAQALDTAPIGAVRGLIARDTGGWGKVFAEQPTAMMRAYSTAGFNRFWAEAMKHNRTEPVLDGDPITGWQGVTRVEERAMTMDEADATTARVAAELMVTADGQSKPEKVVFSLRLENQHWRFDDITDPGMPSIRSYFRQSYGDSPGAGNRTCLITLSVPLQSLIQKRHNPVLVA